MEGDFLDGLYWEEWYNDGDEWENFPCPGHPNASSNSDEGTSFPR